MLDTYHLTNHPPRWWGDSEARCRPPISRDGGGGLRKKPVTYLIAFLVGTPSPKPSPTAQVRWGGSVSCGFPNLTEQMMSGSRHKVGKYIAPWMVLLNHGYILEGVVIIYLLKMFERDEHELQKSLLHR